MPVAVAGTRVARSLGTLSLPSIKRKNRIVRQEFIVIAGLSVIRFRCCPFHARFHFLSLPPTITRKRRCWKRRLGLGRAYRRRALRACDSSNLFERAPLRIYGAYERRNGIETQWNIICCPAIFAYAHTEFHQREEKIACINFDGFD